MSKWDRLNRQVSLAKSKRSGLSRKQGEVLRDVIKMANRLRDAETILASFSKRLNELESRLVKLEGSAD